MIAASVRKAAISDRFCTEPAIMKLSAILGLGLGLLDLLLGRRLDG
jgi:hypothetical protein